MVVRVGRNRDPLKQPRRLSRREREVRQRRFLFAGMAAVTLAVVLLLAGGALYEFVLRPREVLATVNGVEIRRGDYWKYRRHSLIEQIQQGQFYAAQNPQYARYVQQLQGELPLVKQSPVDTQTLSGMIDNVVVQQGLGDLGLAVTDADLQAYIAQNFSPVPIQSPTPSPTLNPTAELWSNLTATAAAITPTPPVTAGTPGAGIPATPGTPSTPATPASPGTLATPATPASPDAPEVTRSATPEPPATPNREQALATATVTYGDYLNALKEQAGMSREDFVRLVAEPEIAKQKARDKLASDVQDVQPQVHAAHILLATRDGAEAALAAVTQGGKDFAEVAREQSTDTSTAPNGGDLGWFPRGVMVKEFEDVAFAPELGPGGISQPVQSKFGWHVIKVIEKEDARPLTKETLQQIREGAFQKWLDGRKEGARITSTLTITPTPARTPFEAPPGAPPTPIPTPPPTPARDASPVAPPDGSPAVEPSPTGAPTR